MLNQRQQNYLIFQHFCNKFCKMCPLPQVTSVHYVSIFLSPPLFFSSKIYQLKLKLGQSCSKTYRKEEQLHLFRWLERQRIRHLETDHITFSGNVFLILLRAHCADIRWQGSRTKRFLFQWTGLFCGFPYSEISAHVWSYLGYLIFFRHLHRSGAPTNLFFPF